MSMFNYKPSTSSLNKPTFSLSKNSPTLANNNDSSNNGNQSRINQFDYVPKRFGLRYDPPTIIVEYLVPSSGKLYHHKMKIVNLTANASNKDVMDSLRKKHPLYFAANKITDKQLDGLIEKLKKKVSQDQAADSKPGNKAGSNSTSTNFFSKTAQPSSLEPASTTSGSRLGPLNTITPSTKPTSFSLSKNGSGNTFGSGFGAKKEEKAGNGFWDVDEDEDREVDYQTTNLNKLTPEEVAKHKAKMDVAFKKNQKRPGDPGFVYDVQEDFHPQEENEWDEDEEF